MEKYDLYTASYAGIVYGNGADKEWGNSEYKEIRINWSKVPTDTPIYVNGKPKYFASYETDDKIYCFPNGTTSFTNNNESCESYSLFREDIELAKPEDVKKYLV